MLRKYVISVPTQHVDEVERFLFENNLITGITVDPVWDPSSGITTITVMVRNKKNFLRWANPRKKFAEAADPSRFLIGEPQEIPTSPVKKLKDRKDINKLKGKLKK
jgi:hypothetical protein